MLPKSSNDLMNSGFSRRNLKSLLLISVFALLLLPSPCEAIEIVAHPHITALEIPGDFPVEISLAVRTLPGRFYQWQLEGPGSLIGDPRDPTVIYVAPLSLDNPEAAATIKITVVDEGGKKTTDSLRILLQRDIHSKLEEVVAPPPLNSIKDLLKKAEAAFKKDRFTTPKSVSAFFYYQRVLEKDPTNKQAKDGIERILATYERRIRRASKPSQASSLFKRYRNVANYYSKMDSDPQWKKKMSALIRFTKPPIPPAAGKRVDQNSKIEKPPPLSPFVVALKKGEEAMVEGRLRSASSHLFNAMTLGKAAAVIPKLKELEQISVSAAISDLKAEEYRSAALKYRYARMIDASLSALVDGEEILENPIEEWHQSVAAAISDGDQCFRESDCDLKSALDRYQDALRLDPINPEVQKRLKQIARTQYQQEENESFQKILDIAIYFPLKRHILQNQKSEEASHQLRTMELVVLYQMSIEWLKEYGENSKEFTPIIEDLEKQYEEYKKALESLTNR